VQKYGGYIEQHVYVVMQCYCLHSAAAAVSVHRADWQSSITDQLVLPGLKAKGLMEKASFKSVSSNSSLQN